MIDRDELAARNMTALLSNPGGPIQPNPASGWGYVNCGAADVATIAVGLADALLSALAVPPAAALTDDERLELSGELRSAFYGYDRGSWRAVADAAAAWFAKRGGAK